MFRLDELLMSFRKYILMLEVLQIFEEKNIKNVENVETQAIELYVFVQELIRLWLCYLPFSPKYYSQGLDLFQSIVTSNKY